MLFCLCTEYFWIKVHSTYNKTKANADAWKPYVAHITSRHQSVVCDFFVRRVVVIFIRKTVLVQFIAYALKLTALGFNWVSEWDFCFVISCFFFCRVTMHSQIPDASEVAFRWWVAVVRGPCWWRTGVHKYAFHILNTREQRNTRHTHKKHVKQNTT